MLFNQSCIILKIKIFLFIGHFLLLRLTPKTKELNVTSPLFKPSGESCKIQLRLYQENMTNAFIHLVVDTVNHSKLVTHQIHGDDSRRYIFIQIYCRFYI